MELAALLLVLLVVVAPTIAVLLMFIGFIMAGIRNAARRVTGKQPRLKKRFGGYDYS